MSDLINREAALEVINLCEGICDVSGEMKVLIENIPSEYKTGEWLLDGRCSKCFAQPLTSHKNFCPNCGAKMGGDTE